MAASFDADISVIINLDTPPVSSKGFGTVLLASTVGPGFSDTLVRTYAGVKDVADDADLTASMKTALGIAFSQGSRVQRVKIGDASGTLPQIERVTVANATGDGDTYTITVTVGSDGAEDFEHDQLVGQEAAEIAGALKALISAGGQNVSITDVGGGVLDIISDDPEVAIVVTVSHTDTPTAITAASQQVAVTLSGVLDLISAEDDDWFGLVLDSRTKAVNLIVSAWTESRKKLFIAESQDADILAVGDADVFSLIQDASRFRTAMLYHDDATEWAALAWAADRLGVDPDTQTTIWKFVTLTGVTPAQVTSTQKGIVQGKGGNLYLTLGSQGSTGDGVLADGHKIDELITADWLSARLASVFQQILLDYSNAGEKVPYTDAGFEIFGAAARSQLVQGENVGHFEPKSSFVTLPSLKDIPAQTRTSRKLSFILGARPAGAIEGVTVTGYVSFGV